MRRRFRFLRVDRRRLIASSALAVALVAVIVAWLAYDAAAASSDVSGARRPVILVAGICSQNPAQSMSEIYQWLQEDLNYAPEEIILFDYRDTTPLASPLDAYEAVFTLVSIDGAGGSASNLRGLIDSQVAAGEQVDIIAHSQGGVVSLYAALDFAGQGGPSVAGKIHSIVTIESPVRGISDTVFSTADLFNFIGWSCASSIAPSVIDMHPDPEEPFDPNHVINMIAARNWVSNPNPYIINVANTEDIMISNGLTPDGERGFLLSAHEWIHQDLGATLNPVDAHSLPLKIISNSAAAPVGDRLLRALVEYQLQSLFLAGDSDLNPALAAPNLAVSFAQTRVLLANGQSRIHPALVAAPIEPAPLTDVFLGGGSAGMKPGLMPPALAGLTTQVQLVGPLSVLGDNEIQLTLQADDVTDLAGAQLALAYDPTLLTFVNAQLSADLSGCESEFNDSAGAVELIFACGTGRSGTPLELWKLTFTAAAVADPTETTVTVASVDLADGQAPSQAILASGSSHTVTVLAAVCGDLNGDGDVNVFDAITTLQIIVGLITPTEAQLMLGDVVRDGTINVFDAILLLQHIVGLIEITECGPA